jgi:hypothetical protein
VPIGDIIGTAIIGGTAAAGIVRTTEGLTLYRTDIAVELIGIRRRPIDSGTVNWVLVSS